MNDLPEPLLTRKHAARYLRLHPGTLRNWASQKKYDLPVYKIGGAIRYKKSDLEKFEIHHHIRRKNGER